MDKQDKDKIEKIIAERKKANKFYNENSSVYKLFVEMEQKTYKDGNLKKKHKELIAIGGCQCVTRKGTGGFCGNLENKLLKLRPCLSMSSARNCTEE